MMMNNEEASPISTNDPVGQASRNNPLQDGGYLIYCPTIEDLDDNSNGVILKDYGGDNMGDFAMNNVSNIKVAQSSSNEGMFKCFLLIAMQTLLVIGIQS